MTLRKRLATVVSARRTGVDRPGKTIRDLVPERRPTMARWWLALGILAVSFLAPGCDELDPKGNAKPKASEVGEKSIDQMRGAAGIAPPGGLQ